MKADDSSPRGESDPANQGICRPSTSTREAENESDTSSLSDPPSELESPSPLTKKQPRPPPPPPITRPGIPKGYKTNSITGTLMVDPESRNYVADFRAMYHPNFDFSSGQYVHQRSYEVATRHVPPNVPNAQSPWAAPLGPATARDEGGYQGPREVERRVDQGKQADQQREPMSVTRDRVGRAVREYQFREDSSWTMKDEETPTGGKGEGKAKIKVEEEDDEDQDEGVFEDGEV